MTNFNFDKDKAINACLYILNQTGKADFHKFFKILYFAEQKHLTSYGRPITGDEFQAMNFGPVPSIIYDIFKAIEHKNNPFINHEEYSALITVSRESKIPFIEAKAKADADQLAVSELEILDSSIQENIKLTFDQLTEKSHDTAWLASSKSVDIEMSYIDIAKAGGADENILKYIQLLSENSTAQLA